MTSNDASSRLGRLSALQPPEGFAQAPTVEDVLARVFVYHEGRRREQYLPSVWEKGYLDLYVGGWPRHARWRHAAIATAAQAQPGDVLMVEAVGYSNGERLHERPPLRWLLIARLASIVETDDGLRAHITRCRVMRDVPRDVLPAGVPEALHASANTKPFLGSVTAVLHPALSPTRG